MRHQIVVVYNQKSGSALPARDLRALFKSAGFEVLKMIAVSKTLPNDVAPYIRKGMRIAAVGGDGTISAVSSMVAGTSAVLVPIPGGTLNNFTKDLGVQQTIEQAVNDAAKGKVKNIDVASVNDIYFVNNSSIGVYPRSLVIRGSIQGRLGKWPAAMMGIAKVLIRYRTYRVTIDGKSVTTPFVFVGNNDYKLELAGLGNRTKLDGGKMCVYIVNSSRRWSLVRMFVKSLFGAVRADKELIMYRTSSLTIESRPHKMHVSHDGEISTLALPLRYELHAGSLKVVTGV